MKTRKKEDMEINYFFYQISIQKWFCNGIHSLLKLGALTFTVCDLYRYFVGQAVIDVTKYVMQRTMNANR